MSDETSILWCLPSNDCTLHDYAAFLSVTFALNTTFFIWWNRIHEFIQRRLESSKDKRDEELAKTDIVREDDGGRSKCDTCVYWIKQAGRCSSALVAVIILGVLLFFRSSSPMSFWPTAFTLLVGPSLMLLAYIIHWVWLWIIEALDAHFTRGANAANTKAKKVPLRDGQSEVP